MGVFAWMGTADGAGHVLPNPIPGSPIYAGRINVLRQVAGAVDNFARPVRWPSPNAPREILPKRSTDITAVEPTSIQASEPIRGAHGYAIYGYGGGPVDAVQFPLNLDSATKGEKVRVLDSKKQPVFPRNVPSGSPDEYDITIDGKEHNYTFDIHVAVQGPDGSSDVTLDNGGRHYTLASTQFSTHANEITGQWQVEQNPFDVSPWLAGYGSSDAHSERQRSSKSAPAAPTCCRSAAPRTRAVSLKRPAPPASMPDGDYA